MMLVDGGLKSYQLFVQEVLLPFLNHRHRQSRRMLATDDSPSTCTVAYFYVRRVRYKLLFDVIRRAYNSPHVEATRPVHKYNGLGSFLGFIVR